jgi:hypothetical protein
LFFDVAEYVPLFNLVVKVKEGKIYEVVWDQSCNGCKKAQCKEFQTNSIFNVSEKGFIKNCFSQFNDCNKEKSSINCDPKFYITWFGTDKKNRQLKSSALAMSKFKRYSTSSLYKSIFNIFKDITEKIQEKWGDINKAINDILNKI